MPKKLHALLALTVPLLGLQLLVIARSTDVIAARLAGVARDVSAALAAAESPAGVAPPILITDHPMWLAGATGSPAIALPDEPPAAVADLARTYAATWLVVMDPAGRLHAPDTADPAWAACLAGEPVAVGPSDDPAWLLRLAPACGGAA